MNALWTLAVVTLAALPLARLMRRQPAATAQPGGTSAITRELHDGGLKAALREALADRSYLLLHAGFLTCGFHVAFLVTHLPGEVQLWGLAPEVASWSIGIIGFANIIGSLAAGWGVQNFRSKYILFWMYASRSVLIVMYLVAPKTELTFYIFAVGLGLTWLATVPPTAGVVGKLFGTHYIGTLFGLTLLSHQIGAFFGAWLGGLAITHTGNYDWMWAATLRSPRWRRFAICRFARRRCGRHSHPPAPRGCFGRACGGGADPSPSAWSATRPRTQHAANQPRPPHEPPPHRLGVDTGALPRTLRLWGHRFSRSRVRWRLIREPIGAAVIGAAFVAGSHR